MQSAPIGQDIAPRKANLRVVIAAVLALVGLLKAFAAAHEYLNADSQQLRSIAVYHGVAGVLACVVLGAYALRASRAR